MKRLSRLFVPLKKFKPSQSSTSIELLHNYGYVRRSSAGVFNMLPLGVMIQSRIESIIRKRMNEIGCEETSLCTLASPHLWKASGRFQTGTEFFMVDDGKFLLAPTNEEEITNIMTELSSYKQVPLRLYQISRKFRNEKRPRGGLLRGKEFTMKDLYSFDESMTAAFKTYEDVQMAYSKIFKDIGLPFDVAEADSGSIGGPLSHEYHYRSEAGEDTIVNCSNCGYTANTERAVSLPAAVVKLEEDISSKSYEPSTTSPDHVQVKFYVSEDDNSSDNILAAIYPENRSPNLHLLKSFIGDNSGAEVIEIDPSKVLKILETNIGSGKVLPLIDVRIDRNTDIFTLLGLENRFSSCIESPTITSIVNVESGEVCSACNSPGLKLHPAIEVGHTFYLGTKYSDALNARITTSTTGNMEPLFMGCYGIGVSRLISAVAEVTHDEYGLVWPKSVTPFDAVIVTNKEDDAKKISEALTRSGITSVWDDRSTQFSILLGNARGMGFPLAIIAGKHYSQSGQLEVQVRSKSTKQGLLTKLEDLSNTVRHLLSEY